MEKNWGDTPSATLKSECYGIYDVCVIYLIKMNINVIILRNFKPLLKVILSQKCHNFSYFYHNSRK